jgi:hypothetical protein
MVQKPHAVFSLGRMLFFVMALSPFRRRHTRSDRAESQAD